MSTLPDYTPNKERYKTTPYRRCGRSGILLPAISLGLWQNFGQPANPDISRSILHTAFDNGITHFDLANNYGPPYGAAEENFGKYLRQDFAAYRDELLISTKAGYDMWEGPYGNWGSRKYLVASCDQSLKRLGVNYVDIFYSHRPDPNTPIEETMGALDYIVRSGRALYAGISNYNAEQSEKAISVLKDLGTPCLIHQVKYSIYKRDCELGLMDVLDTQGAGCIAFSPLAQGLLTHKYLEDIPANSRAADKTSPFLTTEQITEVVREKTQQLNDIAIGRNQTLAQMAISWLLKDERVSSVLIGASRPEQVLENLEAVKNFSFSADELKAIDAVVENFEYPL